MRRQIGASIRAGEATTRLAERLLDVGDVSVRLPQHVRELSDAARLGDNRELKAAIRRWRGQIARLGQGASGGPGEFTMRSATRDLVRKLETATSDAVDRHVNRWVLERARFQARMIARTETARAYRDATVAQATSRSHVVGIRWTLSAAHPRPDICDVLAGVDGEGLGPGGYSFTSLPPLAHPLDTCVMVPIVDRHHLRRELAQRRGTPAPPREWETGRRETPSDWLGRQSDQHRLDILGPGRLQHFERDPASVFAPGTRLRPLYEINGLPRPVRTLGPRVDPTPLIDVDRASMVRPFPPTGG